MAKENSMKAVRAAEDASCWARVTADAINHAAWGERQDQSSQPWVALHSRTVLDLCEHIDALVTIIVRGQHGDR